MAELITTPRPIQIFNPTTDQIYESLRPTLTNPTGGPVPAPTPVYMIPGILPERGEPTPNQIAINEPNGVEEPKDNKKLLVVGALGLGALLLFSNKGKNVSGKKKKSLLIPALILGGAAAYYFFTKKPEQAAEPAAPGGSYYNPEEPSAYIEPPVPLVEQGRAGAAGNAMPYLTTNWPQYLSVFNQMTDSEIVTMYQYLYGFVSFGKKLYQYPGTTGQYSDGDWNTSLYNAVSAIRSKYNLTI